MAHIYIKKLFISAQKDAAYNLDKIFVSEWVDQFDGYKKVPLPTYIKSQLASVEKYQNTDGGFMFRYDTKVAQKSSVGLTNYIISSLAALRDIGFTITDKIPNNAITYLKDQLYANQKLCVQKKINCQQRAQEGMDTINAILDFSPSDTTTAKMWELVDPYLKDTTLVMVLTKKAIVLGKL